MITNREKQIYNTWLAVTRSGVGKPFRLRKKWDKFEEKNEYIWIKKLASFFQRHDNINIDDYFKAPYVVYPEPENYDLRFYTSMKAMKCYRIYLTKLNRK